jgi:ribonuclease-3
MDFDILVKELEDRIGYRFKNEKLLLTAMTHSSAVNELKSESNQRLEFLGDSVIQLVISTYIYENLPSMNEGALSKLRSLIVCADSLHMAASLLPLSDFLILGKGEQMSGGRGKKNIIADAFESLVGSIYLDGGYEPARLFIMDSLKTVIEMAVSGELTYDYKTTLQELAQSLDAGKLVYELMRIEGPEHDQAFFSRVLLGKRAFNESMGHNRKQSEQNAAEYALRELGVIK